MSDVDRTTRRWRLRAYRSRKKEEKACHDSVCRGDQALDVAMARLERDQTIVRITAEPA